MNIYRIVFKTVLSLILAWPMFYWHYFGAPFEIMVFIYLWLILMATVEGDDDD